MPSSQGGGAGTALCFREVIPAESIATPPDDCSEAPAYPPDAAMRARMPARTRQPPQGSNVGQLAGFGLMLKPNRAEWQSATNFG